MGENKESHQDFWDLHPQEDASSYTTDETLAGLPLVWRNQTLLSLVKAIMSNLCN